MPSAARHARVTQRPSRSAGAFGRAARSGQARPRAVRPRMAISKIAWDRKFRTVMLVVLGLVGYLGVSGGLELLHTRAQAEQQQAIVQTLARQNRALEQQQRQLRQPATIIRDARTLGMVKAGERAYAVTGLP
jgi:cell division protein FtsB